MEQALYIRETIINQYRRHEAVILFLAKFFIGIIILNIIGNIGYSADRFLVLSQPPFAFPFTVLMSLLCAILPITFVYGLIIVNIGIQISASIGVAVFVTMFLLCVLFFYIRFAPKESVLIIATVMAFYFNIPYLIPIIAGLYFGLTSIIPISIGIIIWDFVPVFASILEDTVSGQVSVDGIAVSMSEMYISIVASIGANEQWIFTSFIFAIIVVVVFVISRSAIDYAKDIAIGIGTVLSIISFLIAAIVVNVDMSVFAMIFFVILSAVIAETIMFFDIVLDYQSAEKVQFEDDNNYYYVKIIPKVILSKPKRTVRRIRPSGYYENQTSDANGYDGYSQEYSEDYDDDNYDDNNYVDNYDDNYDDDNYDDDYYDNDNYEDDNNGNDNYEDDNYDHDQYGQGNYDNSEEYDEKYYEEDQGSYNNASKEK